MNKSFLSAIKSFAAKRTSIFALVFFGSFAVNTSANASYIGYLSGDSFSNGANEWHQLIDEGTILNNGVSGTRLIQMEVNFANKIDNNINNNNIDFAIIQGGTNDIIDDAVSVADMQAAITSMSSEAISRDLPLLIVNIAPWENAPTQAKRDEIDAYNAWLDATFFGSSSVYVVDIYSLLVDPNNAQHMNPIYDLDGVHPTSAGHNVIADAVDAALLDAFVVPVPAAVWLFGSGLLGLISVARRHHA